MDQVKFFKGCFPQILFSPFWNTLSHMITNFQILTPMDLNPRILFSTLMICDFDNGMILFIYLYTFGKIIHYRLLQMNFLSPDKLSGRNDVTSNKVSFRKDIRQNFFVENQDIKSLHGS